MLFTNEKMQLATICMHTREVGNAKVSHVKTDRRTDSPLVFDEDREENGRERRSPLSEIDDFVTSYLFYVECANAKKLQNEREVRRIPEILVLVFLD